MIRPEFLALMLYTLEMFRRGQWNFIRVELEHLDLMKKYQICYSEALPFVNDNGRFVLNTSNLVDFMNSEKEDKIKVELKQLFISVKKEKPKKKPKMAVEQPKNFEEYIEDYKQATRMINSNFKYISKE